jgi:HlyD family secretion protein
MDGSDSERSQKLFRKVALARLSSPDRLDALLGIDRPNVQLGVIGAAILLTAFVVWGFVWRFEQKVAGRCILTSPSGIAEVTASAGGVVGGLTAKLGDASSPASQSDVSCAPSLMTRSALHVSASPNWSAAATR